MEIPFWQGLLFLLSPSRADGHPVVNEVRSRLRLPLLPNQQESTQEVKEERR